MNFPHPMVAAYPNTEAMAILKRMRRNGPEQKPSRESPMICLMTMVVPDLPLPDTERVRMENTDVTVPMLAVMEMNLAGSRSFTKADINVAPAVAVTPGNQPAIRPAITPMKPGVGPTGSRPSSLCFLYLALAALSSSGGIPNSPVSRGNSIVPPSMMP